MSNHYRSSDDASTAAGLIVIFVLMLVATFGFVVGFVTKALMG